jgi:hypothetical protein
VILRTVFLPVLGTLAWAQQAQNPSPMVEHTREHPRLTEETPKGRREALELGTLFVPEKLAHKRTAPLLIFFHGGKWLPEVAVARDGMVVISIQIGAGSGVYVRAFSDPSRLQNLLKEAEQKAGMKLEPLTLGGWSAGCGAIREILKSPEAYARTDRVIAIDGIHTDYKGGKPGPLDSKLTPENLENWTRLARDAIAGTRSLLITHTEIFPGTFASTTETADYLLAQLHLKRRPVLRWGPMRTQELSEVRAGRFRLIGFAGNTAPDHVDQLHSLPEYLKWK